MFGLWLAKTYYPVVFQSLIKTKKGMIAHTARKVQKLCELVVLIRSFIKKISSLFRADQELSKVATKTRSGNGSKAIKAPMPQ